MNKPTKSKELNDSDDRRRMNWEFEKKIPISLIFVLLFQTLAFTWAASATFVNVDNNAKNIIETKSLIKEIQTNIGQFKGKAYMLRDAERDFQKLSKIENRLKELEIQITNIRIELGRISGNRK